MRSNLSTEYLMQYSSAPIFYIYRGVVYIKRKQALLIKWHTCILQDRTRYLRGTKAQMKVAICTKISTEDRDLENAGKFKDVNSANVAVPATALTFSSPPSSPST